MQQRSETSEKERKTCVLAQSATEVEPPFADLDWVHELGWTWEIPVLISATPVAAETRSVGRYHTSAELGVFRI